VVGNVKFLTDREVLIPFYDLDFLRIDWVK